MVNAGFNPLQIMSEKTGKSMTELKDEMSKGAISSEAVQQAFLDATNAGGKFQGMSENASKTISGQLSMLQDATDLAFNEMGQKAEGVIMDGIELATTLVTHYEEVAKVVGALAAAYGSWKAAVMLQTAVEKSRQAVAANAAKEVAQIDARTAAVEAEIAKRKELIAIMNGEKEASASSTFIDEDKRQNPDRYPQQAEQTPSDKLEASKATLDSLDQEIEKRYEIAKQVNDTAAAELANAQKVYDERRKEVSLWHDKHEAALDDLDTAEKAKALADERVARAQDYVDKLKEAGEYDGSGQGSAEDAQAAALELLSARKAQDTAATNLHAAATRADDAQTRLSAAGVAQHEAFTRVKAAQTNADTAAENLHTASVARGVVTQRAATATTTAMTLAQRINAVQTKVAAAAHVIFQNAILSVKNAWNAMKVAMVSNPIGALITIVTTAASAFLMFRDSTDEATESEQKFGEEAAKSVANVNTLYAVVNSASKDSQTYKQSMNELTDICEQYGITLNKEKDLLGQVNDARQTLLYLIRQEGVERQHANSLESLQKAYDKQLEGIQDKIKGEIGSGNDLQDKAVAGMITSAIDARIDALKALEEKETKAYQALKSNSDPKKSAALQKAYNEAVAEYAAALDGVTKETIKVANANGIHTKSADKVARSVRYQAGQAVEAAKAHDAAVNAENQMHEANKRLAASTSNLTGKSKRLADQINAAKLTAEDFARQLDYIKQNFHTVDLTLRLKLDQGQIPQWVKEQFGLGTGKDITKQQVDLAKLRASQANDILEKVKGKKGMRVSYDGGKTYQYKTQQWLAQNAADRNAVSLAVSQAYDEQEAAKKQKPAGNTSKTPKKPKTPKGGGSGRSSAEDAKKQEAEARKRIEEENRDWAEKQEQEARKMREQIAQAEIDRMEEGTEKKLAQMRLDHEKELAQLEDEAKDLRKANIEHARKLYEAEPKNKNKDFTKSKEYKEADTLSEDQTRYLLAKKSSVEAKYRQQLKEREDAEVDAMRSYLKAYGNMQEQRLAIAQTYDKKIAEAKTEGDRRSLQREKEKALADFDADKLKKDINWDTVFNDIDKLSVSYLKNLKAQLKDYLDAHKDLPVESVKEIATKMREIDNTIDSQTNHFSSVLPKLYEYIRAKKEAESKQTESAEANMGSLSAQAEVGSQQAAIAAQLGTLGVNIAPVNVRASDSESILAGVKDKEAAANLRKEFEKLAEAENKAVTASKKAREAQQDSDEAQDKAQLSLKDKAAIASEALGLIGKKLGQLSDIASELGIGEGTVVGKALKNGSAAFNSAGAAAASFASGDYLGAALNGISAVKSLGAALGIKGAEARRQEKLAKINSKLNERAEALTKSVDGLKSALEKTTGGMKSVEEAEKAKKAQEELNQTKREQLQKNMNSYGKHHSSSYYLDKDMANGGWDELNSTLAGFYKDNPNAKKNNYTSAGSIYANMTPEELDYIRTNNPALYQKITKAGQYDNSKYWDEYADQSGKLGEIEDTMNQKTTQTTFSDMRSEFFDMLSDMNSGAEDFSNNFSKMLYKAVLNSKMSDELDKDLEDFYKKYAEYSKDGLDENEIRELKEEYKKISEKGKKASEEAAKITGYDEVSEQQQGSTKGFQAMTQDTAEELNGRFTALQVSGEQSVANLTILGTKLDSVILLQQAGRDIAKDARDIMATSYLELQSIRDNTAANLKAVKQMASRLETWDNNIKNL